MDTHSDSIENRCNDFLNESDYNLAESRKYSNKGLSIFFICLLFTILIPTLIAFFLNSLILAFCSMIFIFIIGATFFIYCVIKFNKFRLSDKEQLVFRLCKIADNISSFTRSRLSEESIKTAIEINRRIRQDTNPTFSGSTNLFARRGFSFDDKLFKLLILINKLSRERIKESITGKRDDEKLNKLVIQLRNLACLIHDEKVDDAILYLEKDMGIHEDNENKISKFLQKLTKEEGVRWGLATFFVLSGLLIIYLVGNILNIFNNEKPSVWMAFGLIIAVVPTIYIIKEHFTDKLINYFTTKKTK